MLRAHEKETLNLKIGCYVSRVYGWRGYEKNVSGHVQIPLHTMRLLQEAGHEVCLITNSAPDDHSIPFCMPKEVAVHQVTDGRIRIDRPTEPPAGIRPARLLRQIFQIRNLANKEHFDVMHFWGFSRSSRLAGVLKMIGMRAPAVATIFGADFPPRMSGFQRRVWHRLDCVMTATRFVADRAAQAGIETRIVRHGVVRNLTQEMSEYPTNPPHRILFWRDPTLANGADLCMEAYSAVAERFPDLSFDMAIRPNLAELPGIDEAAARHPNVHVYRFPYEQGISLAQLMHESLVIVLPFRSLSMNPQLAVVESLHCGVPVITSNVDSNCEVITPGRNGVLIPAGQSQAIIDALIELLADRHRLAAMRQKIADDFSAEWNWDLYLPAIMAVYGDVVRA